MVLKLLFCDDKGREVRIFVIGAEVEVVGRLWLGGVGGRIIQSLVATALSFCWL